MLLLGTQLVRAYYLNSASAGLLPSVQRRRQRDWQQASRRSSMSVQERDPCPHRIFDDIGGGVWNSVKGARNSPRGERLLGSVTAVKARAPVIGGAPRPLAQHSSTPLRLLRSRAYP